MPRAKTCKPGEEFVFKMPNGPIVGRAKNKEELVNLVKTAPLDAVLYHAKGGHFIPWLQTIGEKKAVSNLRGMIINDKTIRIALIRALR